MERRIEAAVKKASAEAGRGSEHRSGGTLQSSRTDYMTILFGAWLLLGIFIDGYAHRHEVVETFFTPWHAVLYGGFLTSAAWMTGLVVWNRRKYKLPWIDSVPRGYGMGLWGVGVFLCGGLFDMAWHTLFGIEKDTAALLSPAHLMLLVGALLLLSSPYRSAFAREDGMQTGWRSFFPPFLSVALAAAAAGFFLIYAWMFHFNLPSRTSIEWMQNEYGLHLIAVNNEYRGLSYILINTMLFMIPLFLLMKRWILPVGAMTLYFGIITGLNSWLDGFRHFPVIVIALAAGAVGDVLYRALRPWEGRAWAYRIVAAAVPIVLWSLYFAWMHQSVGIGWETELWTGSIVQSALASIAVSLLAVPPGRSDLAYEK
ncbi:hypothetical protein ACFQZE_20500 [Paenibacillus sp. GCM10027627]|uniref:hypothetical protein n=1 Tax=unclassified Paenibacillus TaxID=185978 RepID=UPI003644144F